jgi:hypothetical protein
MNWDIIHDILNYVPDKYLYKFILISKKCHDYVLNRCKNIKPYFLNVYINHVKVPDIGLNKLLYLENKLSTEKYNGNIDNIKVYQYNLYNIYQSEKDNFSLNRISEEYHVFYLFGKKFMIVNIDRFDMNYYAYETCITGYFFGGEKFMDIKHNYRYESESHYEIMKLKWKSKDITKKTMQIIFKACKFDEIYLKKLIKNIS